MMRANTQH